jgi:hypothetical protein
MRTLILIVALLFAGSPSSAQLLDAPAPTGPSTGPSTDYPAGELPAEEAVETTVRFRVGAVITAKRGACRDIQGMVAVPIECDEQQVRIVEEDFSPGVTATFRDLAGGNARQMLFALPFLEGGSEAHAILTYEVTTRTTLPPSDAEAAELKIPDRVPRGLRGYVSPSSFIEARHPKIKKLARQIQKDFEEANPEGSDLERVEAIYDYVMENIEYIEGPDTSAVTTLETGSADCHGRSALIIALCRSMEIPARMVWVNNHVYPEVYLERGEDDGVWLPSESAGTIAFAEMPVARPILQKGDDFRIPERRGEKLRYASEYMTALPAKRGSGKPSVKYIREVVSDGSGVMVQ